MSAYHLYAPKDQSAAIIFASPHSGSLIPDDMRAATIHETSALLATQDSHIDKIFEEVAKFGAPLIAAEYARIYIDLNRGDNEIDADMFTPSPDIEQPLDSKLHSGLGVIPRVLPQQVPIYTSKLPVAEINKRLETAYYPYHQKLETLVTNTHAQWGHVLLIDCHSMPSSQGGLGRGFVMPDIALGTRYGKSANPETVKLAEKTLTDLGFTVKRNNPYAGGFCTQKFGKPIEGIEALQIEINRALYMDETTRKPHDGFDVIKERFTRFAEIMIASRTIKTDMAAE